MKYNEPEKWKFTKLDYSRRKDLIDHPDKRLPVDNGIAVPDGKFKDYLFGGENKQGLAKGNAFSSRLGYNIDNWEELSNEIKQKSKIYPVSVKGSNEYGIRYEQKIVLYGKKGTPANVIVGWIKKPDRSVSMTSTYIKETNY